MPKHAETGDISQRIDLKALKNRHGAAISLVHGSHTSAEPAGITFPAHSRGQQHTGAQRLGQNQRIAEFGACFC